MQTVSPEQVLEEARKRFDAAEVFEESGETLSVSFEDNRLKEIKARQFRGLGLRVIHRGRIGFASTTDLRDPARLVEMAAASAQFGDEARFELPSQPGQVGKPETYDEGMLRVDAQQLVDMGRQGLELSLKADPAYLYGCGIARSAGSRRILNTRGLDFRHPSTEMSAGVGVQQVSDEGLLQVYEMKEWCRPFETVQDLTEAVLGKVKTAATVVKARLEAMPMIFTPKALDNLLAPLEIALNGKHVHKGSSVLRGRLGERVLDERLTVTDDPGIAFAPGSCPVDDEGVPTGPRDLFANGVAACYLTDLQTAALLGTAPTGHGFRSYSSRPAPGATNTVISAGDVPLDEMIQGLKHAVIIDQTLGSGQSNLLAGDFSVNLDLGFLVEDGQVRGRVKDCMVAGNVYELLKRVEAISSERQWVGDVYAPAIMLTGMKLAAQG
jgi:PmbA protein